MGRQAVSELCSGATPLGPVTIARRSRKSGNGGAGFCVAAFSSSMKWSHRIMPHVSRLRSIMSQTRANHTSAERRLAYRVALASLALIASVPATGLPAKKPVAGLEGSWSGGGTVSFASGSTERARCRAYYRRAGSASYTLDATCATASGRASQTASVRQVAENRYAGSFYNSEYGISGVISIVLHGRSQTVRLQSDSGSAVISLSR